MSFIFHLLKDPTRVFSSALIAPPHTTFYVIRVENSLFDSEGQAFPFLVNFFRRTLPGMLGPLGVLMFLRENAPVMLPTLVVTSAQFCALSFCQNFCNSSHYACFSSSVFLVNLPSHRYRNLICFSFQELSGAVLADPMTGAFKTLRHYPIVLAKYLAPFPWLIL